MNDYIRYPIFGKYYKFTPPEKTKTWFNKYIVDFDNGKIWGTWSGSNGKYEELDVCNEDGAFNFNKWLREGWVIEELDKDDLFIEFL